MSIKRKLGIALKNWLPLAAAIVIISGSVYVAVHQNYRATANDPQIQIAEDVIAAIEQGQSVDALVPPNPTVEMSKSLSPFLIAYDDSGKPIGGSVQLDGKVPALPAAVFAEAKKKGEVRITWQPKSDVHMATVVRHYGGEKSGFVAVGRSLREIEKRTAELAIIIAIATAAALLVTFLINLLFTKPEHHEHHAHEHAHEHEHAA